MAGKRSYEDACGTAHALDLIGERWALLVVRELMFGPKRFTDLRAGLPGISPNVLTQRLDELERASILRRHKLPPPAAAWVYELTDWGLELEAVIMTLGRWGARSPNWPAEPPPISVDSLMMSFKTMFDRGAAAGLDGRVQFVVGEQPFRIELGRDGISVERGRFDAPDATVQGSADTIAGVVYGGAKLAEALREGTLRIDGDKALVKRLIGLFPLPARAPATVSEAGAGARGRRSLGRTAATAPSPASSQPPSTRPVSSKTARAARARDA